MTMPEPESRKSSPLTVVSADPAPVERRRRRRLLLRSVIGAFVLIFGWIGVMVGLQVVSNKGYNFRAETQLVLEQIRDGKVELVYKEASARMQEAMIPDRFLELGTDINAALGGFRGILAIKRVESTDGPGGRTGRVNATLEFDKGKTSATFSYHWIDGGWRLLGFNILIPDELKGAVLSRVETQTVRTEAPTEVHELARRILELGREGGSGVIYDQAAPTFRQSVDRNTFFELQADREQILGRYVLILDVIKSWINLGHNHAELILAVQYQNARATVTMDFFQIDGVWQLSHYKIVMPQPRIPGTAVTPPIP